MFRYIIMTNAKCIEAAIPVLIRDVQQCGNTERQLNFFLAMRTSVGIIKDQAQVVSGQGA